MFNPDKHRTIMVEVLKKFYADEEIGTALGFKGGTAAYLFYGLPRVSVDLDFNLLKPERKDQIFAKIVKILGQFGQIREAREKYFTLFFLLSYEKGGRGLKIEISKRPTGGSFLLQNTLGISMLVMKKEDALAYKLSAVLGRKRFANRDLFDLWFFLKEKWGINEEIIKKETGQEVKAYLKKVIKRVEKVDNDYLLDGLGELLDNRQKEWAKRKLKEELLFYLRLYLEIGKK